MITLLIYCIFSYLFMGAYAWDTLTEEEYPFLVCLIIFVWLFSPVLMPIMLGTIVSDNEIK